MYTYTHTFTYTTSIAHLTQYRLCFQMDNLDWSIKINFFNPVNLEVAATYSFLINTQGQIRRSFRSSDTSTSFTKFFQL